MLRRILFALTVLLGVIVLTSLLASLMAEGQDGGAGLALAGKGYYYRAWGATPYACIHCHANFDEAKFDDGYWRPAHALWNASSRPSYYNGAYEGGGEVALARAINTCAVAFLKADPLPLEDEKMQALLAYLRSISPEAESPLVTITRVSSPPEVEGDPRSGEQQFNASCMLCHREKGAAPPLTFAASPFVVMAKVRGYKPPADGLDEPFDLDYPMPFFSAERLTGQQVADVAAFWEYRQLQLAREAAEEALPTIEALEEILATTPDSGSGDGGGEENGADGE